MLLANKEIIINWYYMYIANKLMFITIEYPQDKVHCAISAANNNYLINYTLILVKISSTVLDSQLSVLGPWSLVLGPWSSVFSPGSSVLGPWSLVIGPQSSVLGLQSWVFSPGSTVLGHWSLVLGSICVCLATCLQIQDKTSRYFVHDFCQTCIKTMFKYFLIKGCI